MKNRVIGHSSLLSTFLAVSMGILNPAWAASIPVSNAGFEDTSGALSVFNEFTFGSPAGWTAYNPFANVGNGNGSNDIWLGTLEALPGGPFFSAGAPEGNRVGLLYNRPSAAGSGAYGLEQALVGEVLTANTHYQLQVEVGNIGSGVAQNGTAYDLDGFPGYRVELTAGGVVVAVDDNSLAGVIPEYEFVTSTLDLMVGASHALLGQELGIRLINLNQPVVTLAGPQDGEVDFDNVRLTTQALPLMPTLLLVLLGLLGLRARGAGSV